MDSKEIVAALEKAAEEIAREGHAGWGNTCQMAAEEIARLRAELERTQKRLNWAANELLACDYGDNDAGPGVVGWLVYGWRDRKPRQHHEHRRIHGSSINEAIDAEIP